MLKLQHLTKRFGAAPLFTDLCMEVDAPVVLWAPSGWGKTTLLRCLNGLEPVQAGRVKLGSETVAYGGKNLAALRQRILLFCRFRLCRSCGQ